MAENTGWTDDAVSAAFEEMVSNYGDHPQPAPEVSKAESFLDLPTEQFVPPDPPPLPHLDRIARFAWAGVLGGPAVLLVIAVSGYSAPGWVAPGAVASFVSGFITLVSRSKGRDSDDDGAVV